MKIFHHNDMDGRSAAYITYNFAKYCQEQYLGTEDKISLIELDYKKEIDIDSIEKDETVIIVDYSFTESTLPVLLSIINKAKLIWIDHHKSSIELLERHPELLNKFIGLVDDSMSGAALAYKWFNEDKEKPMKLEDMPYWIQLISDYDTWTFKHGKDTINFKLAIDTCDSHPLAGVWEHFYDWDICHETEPTLELLQKGRALKEYIDTENKTYFNAYGFETEFEGHKCIAVNKSSNSWIFGDKLKDYDFGIVFCFNGTNYKYSLFSENKDIDVSKIAEKYNGGGHKGAAGFYSNELLIKKV